MASLLLGDLNDYIEPTQACVIPPSNEKKPEDAAGTAVSINLTDCLACSGCITSAETVLVAQQTYSRLLEAVDSHTYEQIAVSVSPQTVAALAVKYKIPAESAWRKLNHFLKRILGVCLVVDIAHSRSLTLALLAREFVEWKKGKRAGPLIVSACPGWVCYVEKRYKEFVPLLSRTRSPQQMAGSLVKHIWRPQDRTPDKIFHCTIMPCFDKKLEASREDFVADLEKGTKEVDTVITTTELVQIIMERMPEGGEFADLPEDQECDGIARHDGSGSGGYMEYVLAHAIQALHPGVSGHLVKIPGRNADSCEVHYVEGDTGKILLRFAALSGFRNIQTFAVKQRKTPSGALPPLDFVEVMACPGGCLMGGGQPVGAGTAHGEQQAVGGLAARKRLAEQLNEAYFSAPILAPEPTLVQEVLQWAQEDPEHRLHLFRASYKAVEDNDKLKKRINVQW